MFDGIPKMISEYSFLFSKVLTTNLISLNRHRTIQVIYFIIDEFYFVTVSFYFQGNGSFFS